MSGEDFIAVDIVKIAKVIKRILEVFILSMLEHNVCSANGLDGDILVIINGDGVKPCESELQELNHNLGQILTFKLRTRSQEPRYVVITSDCHNIDWAIQMFRYSHQPVCHELAKTNHGINHRLTQLG